MLHCHIGLLTIVGRVQRDFGLNDVITRLRIKIFIILVLSIMAMASHAQTIDGEVVRVIDGDTFIIEVRVRLCGINAPERNETGGDESTSFLTDKINGELVMCRLVGDGTPCDGRSRAKSYNRMVAQCFHAGDDIAETMVENEHATDNFRYSGGYYNQE